MKKNILISLLAVLGLYGVSFAQKDYQGQFSDKKLQLMSMLSSGSIEKDSLENSKESSSYNYNHEHENSLKSIHRSDGSDYQLAPSLLNTDVTHHEDDYNDLVNRASKILGEEKVAKLTNQVRNIVSQKDDKKTIVEISSSMGNIADNNAIKVQKIHIRNTSEITQGYFSLNHGDMNLNLDAKSYTNTDYETNRLYQNLLVDLSDGSGDEVYQLFNLASEEALEGGEFQYQLNDGYPIEEVTTVGLFRSSKNHFKKCLTMKTYGGGTWRTYCQPIAKPTQCTSQEWKNLSTMAIMYC